tara:strand:+ start:180 stop:389 length:210 start_codon:yes stop_codon:yes gene_type:complete
MNRPQTIQIFLPDGSPTSIREAEITNRLVKAVLFPRNKMQEVAKREMVHYIKKFSPKLRIIRKIIRDSN